jgi:hypothetical protein
MNTRRNKNVNIDFNYKRERSREKEIETKKEVVEIYKIILESALKIPLENFIENEIKKK